MASKNFIKALLVAVFMATGMTSAFADRPFDGPWDRHDGHWGNRGWHGPYRSHDRYDRRDRVVVVRPRHDVIIYDNDPYVQVRCSSGATITGTIIGGTAGGLIGNQFGHGRGRTAATVGGVLIGALIGNQIGQANETCASQALEYGRSNTQIVWDDPDGDTYLVRPVKTYKSRGRYCREYQTRVYINGRMQEGYGTACRQPDGSWKMVS
jgi:surface antigen